MVTVQVSERHNVDDLVIPENIAKLFFKIATLIIRVIGVMHIRKVEGNSTTVGKLNQAGIGVTDREKPNNMHAKSLRVGHR